MTEALGATGKKRREWGDGSIYQRASDWRWIGTVEVRTDGRRRATVSNKGCVGGCKPRCQHRADLVKKLRKKQHEIDESGAPTRDARTTVKQWAGEWLAIKKTKLRPRAYNAAASAVRRWIVPTLGHRRLSDLAPADLRALEQAHRDAGRKGTTAHATYRVLMTMLRAAVVEGHKIPQAVFLAGAPSTGESDRLDLSVLESVACLEIAAELPHGIRWAMALLYGSRQGEVLGLVEVDPVDGDPCVDFTAREIRLAWQLDNLPYEHGCPGGDDAPTCGKKRAGSCPQRGFRVPNDYLAVHLVDAWHLVRPKSKKGIRVLPMNDAIDDALRRWLGHPPFLPQRPDNPWGLVFPAADGTPANDKSDLAEWHAIQGAASLATFDAYTDLWPVLVGHPAGRYYHIHECRNFTATQLGEADVDPEVIQSLLGHATAAQSGDYRRIHRGPKLAAIEAVSGIIPYRPRGAAAPRASAAADS